MDTNQYMEVKIPNEHMQHTFDVCIGLDSTQRLSLDEKYLLVKTNQFNIDKKTKEGTSYNKIFPPGLTSFLTYEQAYELSQSSKYQINDGEI